jgi:hypothetical protein
MAALAVLTTVAGFYMAWAQILSDTRFHQIWSLALLSFLLLTLQLYGLPISTYTIPLYILDFAIFALCLALSPAQVLLFPRESPDREKKAITTYHPKSHSPGPDGSSGSDGHSENTIVVEFVLPLPCLVISIVDQSSRFANSILAVHGLASNPKTTWHKPSPSSSVPDSSVDVHNLPSNPETEREKLWLRDCLPIDIPNARIMAFNHNTAWQEDALSKSLHNHADDLLRALDWERQSPVVGRSLGKLPLNMLKSTLCSKQVALLSSLATALGV